MRLRSLIAAVSLVVLAAAPAAAHTDVTSTNPADGSVLIAPQAAISLSFSEPVLAEGAGIVVLDAAGATVATEAVTVAGAELSVPWPLSLTPGQVTVQWRAVADDGHVMTGSFGFVYSPSDEPPVTSPSPLPVVTAPGVGLSDTGSTPWLPIIAAMAVVAVAVAFIVRRR